MVSSTTSIPILHVWLTHRYHSAYDLFVRRYNQFHSRSVDAQISFCWFVGLDGCWNTDILLLCHMFGMSDYTWELQQVQQQLLQVCTL